MEVNVYPLVHLAASSVSQREHATLAAYHFWVVDVHLVEVQEGETELVGEVCRQFDRFLLVALKGNVALAERLEEKTVVVLRVAVVFVAENEVEVAMRVHNDEVRVDKSSYDAPGRGHRAWTNGHGQNHFRDEDHVGRRRADKGNHDGHVDQNRLGNNACRHCRLCSVYLVLVLGLHDHRACPCPCPHLDLYHGPLEG
jgi:hypothetical protein